MTLSRFFRLAVAVGLTAYLLWRSHPSEVMNAAAGASLRWIGWACALVILDRALMAYRWWILLCAVDEGRRPPLRTVLRIFFISTFVGTFLPSVGGDVYRAYSLAREDVRGAQAAGSVMMDRLLGVISTLLMQAAGLFAVRSFRSNPSVLMALGITTAVCAAALSAVFSERVADLGRRMASRIPSHRIQRTSADVIDAVRRFAHFHGQLLGVLVLSILVQVLRIVQAYFLGRALAITLPLASYFALMPIILLVVLLPLTIGGLGTSQAAFVGLFVPAGAGEPEAFALSVLFIALGFVGNLPGALLYAFAPAPGTHRGPSGRNDRET